MPETCPSDAVTRTAASRRTASPTIGRIIPWVCSRTCPARMPALRISSRASGDERAGNQGKTFVSVAMCKKSYRAVAEAPTGEEQFGRTLRTWRSRTLTTHTTFRGTGTPAFRRRVNVWNLS